MKGGGFAQTILALSIIVTWSWASKVKHMIFDTCLNRLIRIFTQVYINTVNRRAKIFYHSSLKPSTHQRLRDASKVCLPGMNSSRHYKQHTEVGAFFVWIERVGSLSSIISKLNFMEMWVRSQGTAWPA
jgi:hypothetical protein